MDATIVLVGLVFLGLIGVLVYLIRDDKPSTPKNTKTAAQGRNANPEADLAKQLQRKVVQSEEKLKALELHFEAVQLELAQTKEREKALLKQKSVDAFDRDQFEKFKKEHEVLRDEVALKEESLEKEIALRREQNTELLGIQKERDDLKKRVVAAEDSDRKTRLIAETLTKELQELKKKIHEQGRIVQEHATSKTQGEWVSRGEFEKVENELREKEAFIKKMLSLNKEGQP